MKSEKSAILYKVLVKLGYGEEFAAQICRYMNTDFTAGMMLGYLKQSEQLRPEDIVDEMLGILELRQSIINKKIASR